MKRVLHFALLMLTAQLTAALRPRASPMTTLADTPQPMQYLDVAVPATWREEPPTEFRIWAFGEVATSKGVYQFTKVSGELCMQWQAEWGNRFSFDYNHAFWEEGAGEASKSAGDYLLKVREDGLWAVDVHWTEAARQGLKSREWLYFSPALDFDEFNVITRLWNIALTNVPATKNQKPLMAASVRDCRTPDLKASVVIESLYALLGDALLIKFGTPCWLMEIFNDAVIFDYAGKLWSIPYTVAGTDVTLGDEATEVTRQYIPVQGGQTMKTILSALGLASTATEAEALQKLNARMAEGDSMQRQLLSATNQTDVQAALGVVVANAQAATQLSAAQVRIQELEGEQRTTKLSALIAQGKADKKLTPALENWAKSQTPEALSAFLEHAPVIQQLNSKEQTPPATDPAELGSGTEGQPVTLNGKKWEEMEPADKHNLYVEDKSTYDALRADYKRRTGN